MRLIGLLFLVMLWAAPAPVSAQPASRCFAQACAVEVSFANGDVRLSGTLYRPESGKVLSALVATHGASEGERSALVFRHLYEALPRVGVAVLVFDRRGSGRSTGQLKDADYIALADDAVAARRFLSSLEDLRDVPVGYWGYSQGGWIATIAGARDSRAGFVVSVSAPLVSPDLQMIEATRNILRIRGASEEDISIAVEARKAVDAHVRGQLDPVAAQAKLDLAKSKPWFPFIYMGDTLEDPRTSRWLKEISHDPMDTLSNVHSPVLLVFGGRDVWIPVEASVDRAEALHKDRLTVVLVDEADHAMMQSLTPAQQIDPAVSRQFHPESPTYFVALASWLTSNGFAHVH